MAHSDKIQVVCHAFIFDIINWVGLYKNIYVTFCTRYDATFSTLQQTQTDCQSILNVY